MCLYSKSNFVEQVMASEVDAPTISPYALDTSSVKDGFLQRLAERLKQAKRQGDSKNCRNFKREEHGAKGLCQERAYVSGIFAANKLSEKLAQPSSESPAAKVKRATIIPVRDDEPQVRLGRRLNRRISRLFNPLGLDSPWLR